MINKINNVNFNGSYIKKSNNVNIKRGLKAAGIFASSTLAATFSLMACKSCIDSHKKTDIQNTNPIENPTVLSDTISLTKEPKEKNYIRYIDNNGITIVKEGDSYWSIAKDLLNDKGVDKPSDTQIWNEMERIMKLNGRKFEEDIYEDDVPIKPNERIYVK